MRVFLLAAALLLLSACAMVGRQLDREGALIDSPGRDWRTVATRHDQARLREWRAAFVDGLNSARSSGSATRVEAEGRLLLPDAALPGPALPNGDYRCRTIKLGARSAGMPGFIAYRAVPCRVSARRGLQEFAELSGMQRPVGVMFTGDAMRSVFLGTLLLGDETRMMQYGGDPDRDSAGYIERIGPRRWRLILPRPVFQSQIDVIELTPLSP